MNAAPLAAHIHQGPPSRRIRSSALLQAALAAQARVASPCYAAACVVRAAIAVVAAVAAVGPSAGNANAVPLIASLAWLAIEPVRLWCGYAGNLRESSAAVAAAGLLSAPQAAAAAVLLARAAWLSLSLAPADGLVGAGSVTAARALHGVDATLSSTTLIAALATGALSARAAARFSRARRRLLLSRFVGGGGAA